MFQGRYCRFIDDDGFVVASNVDNESEVYMRKSRPTNKTGINTFPEQRRKHHLKSDLVFFETSARLSQLANFVTIVREIAWS